MEELNVKVQLPRKEILSRYFMAYNPIWYVISTKYDQISVDKSISEVDATSIVNLNAYSINI